MSIHANHRHLDGACKVEVVVAQVVGARLELVLGHLSGVVNRLEENRLSSGNGGLVRNQVEIVDSISLILNKSSVNNCAWARVKIILS